MRKNNMRTFKILFFISILHCFSNTLLGANYYVSNNGNDNNDGTFTSPLLTIQTALNIVEAGDTIYVREGTYAEKLWWSNSGNSGSPITLTNYNAENVIISGINASNATQGAAILVSSKSYIRINGLIFKDNIMNFADGINVTGSGTDIHITNCEFDNIGWTTNKTTFPTPSDSAHAIIFVGNTRASLNDIYIGGNYIHDCITGFSESMTIAGNVENFLIEGNTLDSNTNIGIDAAGFFTWTGAPDDVNFSRNGIIKDNTVSNYAGPDGLDAAGGIYTDGGSFITIENNTVYNYKVGYSVGCEVPGNSNTGNIVRNNLAYNCSLSGLFLGSNTTSIVNNTQVYNNTFYKCGFGTFDNGQIALQNNNGSIISNNIMYPIEGRTGIIQFVGTTSTSKEQSYNLYWRDSGDTSNFFFGVTGDTNALVANPNFVNANLGDFHLSESSPAINAGDPNYNPGSAVFDIDGQARVLNGRVDIGVDESGETEDSLTVSSLSQFDAGDDSQIITVSSNVNWSVSESTSWISVNTTNGSGNGSITVTTNENTSVNDRFATITISGSGINRTVSVSQAGVNDTPSTYTSIPSLIQAEDFGTQSGIQTENTQDNGGGENVGFIDTGDFLTYNINVPSSGNYSIDFRVASRSNGTSFNIFSGNTNIGSISSEATGGWQIWETVSETVSLNQGDQTIRLVATGNGWNINWLDFSEISTTFPASCSSGSNLSLNGTIVDFSGEQNSTNTVNNLTDGNENNRWSAIDFPQFVTIDLGEEYEVGEINLATFQNRDYQFIVEGSSSSANSGFSTLVDARNNTDQGTINRVFSAETVRYVKLTITGANTYTGPWSSIADFKIICSGSNASDKSLNTNQFEVTAYPNPTTNTMTVTAGNEGQKIGSLRLTDLTGRLILEKTVNANTYTLDNLDTIASGVYLLLVFNTEKQILKSIKIVKE